MENRYSKRMSVKMKVLLYHSNIPVAQCSTSNISADGMFVTSGPVKYRSDTILKVEFRSTTKEGFEFHSLPAMVVHAAESGLGLMLPGGDSTSMQAWRGIVRESILKNSIDKIDEILQSAHYQYRAV